MINVKTNYLTNIEELSYRQTRKFLYKDSNNFLGLKITMTDWRPKWLTKETFRENQEILKVHTRKNKPEEISMSSVFTITIFMCGFDIFLPFASHLRVCKAGTGSTICKPERACFNIKNVHMHLYVSENFLYRKCFFVFAFFELTDCFYKPFSKFVKWSLKFIPFNVG